MDLTKTHVSDQLGVHFSAACISISGKVLGWPPHDRRVVGDEIEALDDPWLFLTVVRS